MRREKRRTANTDHESEMLEFPGEPRDADIRNLEKRFENVLKGEDLKPSAPPMEETPPPGYDFGAAASGDCGRVSTKGFGWYNEEGWRARKKTPESEQSLEEQEEVKYTSQMIFGHLKNFKYHHSP